MIAVAPVTTPTSRFQLGNGPKQSTPTTAVTRIETTGTPRALVLARAPGSSDSSPRA